MALGKRLSGRERQIMEILYKVGQATVSEVQERMPDPPGYSSVRSLLSILEKKEHVCHTQDGARYLYMPAQPRDQAAHSALRNVVQTFFGGSVEQVVASLVNDSDKALSETELERLAQLIAQAREGEK